MQYKLTSQEIINQVQEGPVWVYKIAIYLVDKLVYYKTGSRPAEVLRQCGLNCITFISESLVDGLCKIVYGLIRST